MITDSLGPVTFGLFFLAVLGSFAAVAAFVLAKLVKQPVWAKWIVRLEVAGLALYAVLLLGFSLSSRDQELRIGEEKHICEVDCHLAYSVVGVQRAKQWQGRTATGAFAIVTVRVRFDSFTIAPGRPRNVGLHPNGRSVALVDSQGRRYSGDPQPLDSILIPGQEYHTDFVFDLPDDAVPARFLLASGDWPTHLMIAHENAFLHGRITWRLQA